MKGDVQCKKNDTQVGVSLSSNNYNAFYLLHNLFPTLSLVAKVYQTSFHNSYNLQVGWLYKKNGEQLHFIADTIGMIYAQAVWLLLNGVK